MFDFRRQLFALIGILAIVGALLGASPARAQSRTVTLSGAGCLIHLVDDNTVPGALPPTVTFTNADGSNAHDAGGAGWQNGANSTYWRDICAAAGDVVIKLSGASVSISGASGGYTPQYSIFSWYKLGTLCGGTVTHTTTQSDLWQQASFDATKSTAEWSGFIKYTAPAGKACDVKMDFLIPGATTDHFRPSTTDATKAQWDPTKCAFVGGDQNHVICTYTVAAATQQSDRVKLIAPYPYTTAQFVFAAVTEKDSNGFFQRLTNPGSAGGWTFN